MKINPLPRLHFNAALRYNWYSTEQTTESTFEDTVSTFNRIWKERRFIPPLLGARYDFTKAMSVYASYAGIFNSNADKRTADGSVLKPETGSTYEIGVKRSDLSGRLTSSIALYDTRQVNLAAFDFSVVPADNPATGVSCCYINGGNRRSKGVDAEVAGGITALWQVSLGYTYNWNKFEQQDVAPRALISQAPQHLVKLFTSYRLGTSGWRGGATVGGGGRLQSKALTVEPVFVDDAMRDIEIVQPSYALVDLFARFALTPRISLQLNVNNLFDKRYLATVGSRSSSNFYGEPRNVLATLRGKF